MSDIGVRTEASVRFHRTGAGAGPDRLRLLDAISREGSLSGAARAIGLTYKAVWDAVRQLNNLFDRPLVKASAGGPGGGGATLTEAGVALRDAWAAVDAELARVAEKIEALLAGAGAPLEWRMPMRTSARNMLKGRVKSVTDGAVNAEVVIGIDEGEQDIVAIVTRGSVADLGLAPGVPAYALIKASAVIVAPGTGLRTSARNAITGTVVSHEAGAVNDEVVVGFGAGRTLVATITRGSGETLGLEPGASVTALVKASHVIVAVD